MMHVFHQRSEMLSLVTLLGTSCLRRLLWLMFALMFLMCQSKNLGAADQTATSYQRPPNVSFVPVGSLTRNQTESLAVTIELNIANIRTNDGTLHLKIRKAIIYYLNRNRRTTTIVSIAIDTTSTATTTNTPPLPDTTPGTTPIIATTSTKMVTLTSTTSMSPTTTMTSSTSMTSEPTTIPASTTITTQVVTTMPDSTKENPPGPVSKKRKKRDTYKRKKRDTDRDYEEDDLLFVDINPDIKDGILRISLLFNEADLQQFLSAQNLSDLLFEAAESLKNNTKLENETGAPIVNVTRGLPRDVPIAPARALALHQVWIPILIAIFMFILLLIIFCICYRIYKEKKTKRPCAIDDRRNELPPIQQTRFEIPTFTNPSGKVSNGRSVNGPKILSDSDGYLVPMDHFYDNF